MLLVRLTAMVLRSRPAGVWMPEDGSVRITNEPDAQVAASDRIWYGAAGVLADASMKETELPPPRMSIAPFFISGMATALVSTCLIVTLRPYFWKMPSLAAIYALTSSTTGRAPRVMEVIDPE